MEILVVLESAAPHIAAQAWDRALQDADDQGYLHEHQTELLKQRNPYRTAKSHIGSGRATIV